MQHAAKCPAKEIQNDARQQEFPERWWQTLAFLAWFERLESRHQIKEQYSTSCMYYPAGIPSLHYYTCSNYHKADKTLR